MQLKNKSGEVIDIKAGNVLSIKNTALGTEITYTYKHSWLYPEGRGTKEISIIDIFDMDYDSLLVQIKKSLTEEYRTKLNERYNSVTIKDNKPKSYSISFIGSMLFLTIMIHLALVFILK